MIFNKLNEFLAKFNFQKEMSGYIGIEREHFLMTPLGGYSPRSPEFLKLINDPRWTYELSACQVESRTKPHNDFSEIKLELLENANNGKYIAEKMGLILVNQEVAAESMPLDHYPDERYAEIVRTIPRERLEAACRVAGTHIHIGVKNIEHAISVYNSLVPYVDELCRLGDHSNGERLRLYKTMASKWKPIEYQGLEHFFEVAQEDGFAENPRNCWQLMRISIHGTIELRMFGVTDNIDEIMQWASRIKYHILEHF